MAEHLKKSEAELNELLTEYWKLHHEMGKFFTLSLYSSLNYIQRYTWKHLQTN
jgi:hypothetical protein